MKTIVITGSTDGIGKLAAIQLAKEGHQLVLHGRNPEKLQKTLVEVKALSNNKNLSGIVADLSDFERVITMASKLSKAFPIIDVLINNAGVFNSPIQQNKGQLDIRFAVNYFAVCLLTNGLLSSLKNSNAPRLINLSSAAQSSISFDALSGKEILDAREAYAQSKLALTMWSFYLAKKHNFLNVVAVNPGSLLNTRMVKEAFGKFWSPAEKGSTILYELATLEKYAQSSGKYFDNDKGRFSNAHEDAYDQEKIDRLMNETEHILGL